MILTLLCLWLSFSSLHGDAIPKPPAPSCLTWQGHSFCFGNTATADPTAIELHRSFDRVEEAFLKDNTGSKDEVFKVNIGCQKAQAAGYKLQLSEGRSIPIVLIRPLHCEGFGNQIGFLFELFSFAVSHRIAVGRISDQQTWPESNCSAARNGGALFSHYPRFVIPFEPSNDLRPRDCSGIPEWPWESKNPYFFRHTDILAKVNRHSISSYFSHADSKMARRDSLKVFSHALGIHFRCSDNLAHQYMGLLPYSDYRKVLERIASHADFIAPAGVHAVGSGHGNHSLVRSIVIYTDARLYVSHGEICVRAFAEFEALLSRISQLNHLDVIIHRTTTVQTYALMHTSRFLFCSASTLCFFSAFGNEHSYIPYGQRVVITPPQQQIQLNMTFFETRMIRPARETMPADEFAKVFINT